MTPELREALDQYLKALGNAEQRYFERIDYKAPIGIWYYDEPKPNQKYIRIVHMDNQQTVHSFVEIATGKVFKPAGWSAPARNSFYNLLEFDSKAQLFADCEPNGGYLYTDYHTKKARA